MPTTLHPDIVIFGSAAAFLLMTFILLQGAGKKKKLEKRVERLKHPHQGGKNAGPTISLRRQRDNEKIPLLNALADALALKEKLRGRLELAGMEVSVEKYLLSSLGIFLAILFVITTLLHKPALLGALCGFVAGAGIPHFYVGYKISKRKKRFLHLFPDAIDLIVRGLRAGLPVAKSMQSVAVEIPPPVGNVFHDLVEQIALGVTLEKAMADMGKRLRITEFDFFVTSMILQRETGGNLAEILGNLSEVLRGRYLMRMKIRAMSAEARASAYIVGSLPFLVVVALSVVSPEYLRPLYEDYRGNMAALAAACSMAFGGFIMAKMARFEI